MQNQLQGSSHEINLNDLWLRAVRNKGLLLTLFFISVVSTAIISLLMPKIYRGEALLNVLQYETIQGKEIVQTKEIIEPKEIIDMIGSVDREKRIKIFPKTNLFLKDIKIRAIKESTDKIVVIIDATDVNAISPALAELVDYIDGFEIVKLTVKEEKEKLLARSAELSGIVRSSAGLSGIYRKLLNEGKLLPVGFNPVDLNKRITDIKLEKLGVDQRLQRLNSGGIEIAKQPYIQEKPVKPNILLNIVFAAVASILLGIFILCFDEYLRKLKKTNA